MNSGAKIQAIPLWHALQPDDVAVDHQNGRLVLSAKRERAEERVKLAFVYGAISVLLLGLVLAEGNIAARMAIGLFSVAASQLMLASVEIAVDVQRCCVERKLSCPVGAFWCSRRHLTPTLAFVTNEVKSDNHRSVEVGVLDGANRFVALMSFDRLPSTPEKAKELCARLQADGYVSNAVLSKNCAP